jgi:hypothetical protein
MKQKYIYRGIVKEFDRIIQSNWEGSTYAVSEAKARANLTFQWKREHGRAANCKITLPGPILQG